MRSELVLALIGVGLHGGIATASPARIDCDPLQPQAPVEATVANTVKGQANLVFWSLGSGRIENGHRSVETDVLSRYPNAD